MLGEVPQKWGNRNANVAPGNVYGARDGHVTIECITQEMWESLARAMGREELTKDPRFTNTTTRFRNADALDREIDSWIQPKSVADVLALLERHSVPCGPVLDVPTLVKHPQFLANRIVEMVDHPDAGPLPLFAPAIRLTGDAAPRRGCPPRLGEHTEQVLLEWLGLSAGEVAALRASGVV
jgi:crotonobetainyl-CoA:carnitine CoA-transferase CaiB-like acyl-CoA transferase